MKKFYLVVILFLFSRTASFSQYNWNNVGNGVNSPVYTLTADSANNLLYAGGIFTLSGLTPAVNIAKWDGNNWSPVGGGILSGVNVSSMMMSGSDLIAGGTFTNIGGVLSKNIARWNGSTWSSLGAGLEFTGITVVNALAEYNGDIYAGGVFTFSGTTLLSNIARWDGSNWQPVGSGINGPVRSLCVYGTELYAGGSFTNAGGVSVNNIAKWNGSSWSDVGGGVSYTGATTVSTLKVFSGGLYAGGTFTSAGATPVKHIAKWDGSTWSDVGGGAGSYTGATTVSTLTVFGSDLVAGGSLDSLGGIPVSNIGVWDGSSWSAMGTGTNSSVYALTPLNDTLYAGGLFTTAGGNASTFVAQWQPADPGFIAGNPEPGMTETILLYPNPAKDVVYLSPLQGGHFSFSMFDIIGKKILEEKNVKDRVILDRQNIRSGLYFYRIYENDKLICQGKLSVF